MKSIFKKFVFLLFFSAYLSLVFFFAQREEVEIDSQGQALLQALQSPEAVDVSQQGRRYSLRQVGFDPENPQARCVNYAFFQAEGSDQRGGYDTLGFESSVYFAGAPERVESIRLSYRTAFLFCYESQSSFSVSLLNHRFFRTLLTRRLQYGVHQFENESTFDLSKAPGYPPVFRVYGPDLNITNADIRGGIVVGGLSQISGEIRCKDGAVYRPETSAAFSVDCYSQSVSKGRQSLLSLPDEKALSLLLSAPAIS